MTEDGMYTTRAALYDRIYHWKDYASEATRLCALLDARGVGPGARVLEAACGTGQHLQNLRDRYALSGFDLNAGVLAIAREKLPGVPLFQADMRSFAVEAPYDALLCLFSSIGYLLDAADLRAAADAFARALRPGGTLVVEPWLTVEQWDTGRPGVQTYTAPDLAIARAFVSGRDGEISHFDMSWLVAPRGGPIEHFEERHAMWLCPRATMQAMFEAAGFEVAYDADGLGTGRGLFVGRRR